MNASNSPGSLSRRDALKVGIAAGVAALLPSWLIRPAQRRTIDLMRFCSKEDHPRYSVSLPFTQQEWTYATDGRVCVRVEPQTGDARESKKRLPPADGLQWDHDSRRGWISLPDRDPIVHGKTYCPTCDGRGRVGNYSTCPMCDGEDEFGYCPNKACRLGLVGGDECPMCKGTPFGYYPDVVPAAGVLIGLKYYRKLKALGAVELCVPDEPMQFPKSVPGNNPAPIGRVIRFRFSEGCGLLMPVVREAKS